MTKPVSFLEHMTETAKKQEWPGAEHAFHYPAKDARKNGHHNIRQQLEWNIYPGKFRYIGTAHGHHHFHAKTPGGAERVFHHQKHEVAKAAASKYAHTGQFHSLNMESVIEEHPAPLKPGHWGYRGLHMGQHFYHSANLDGEHKTWSHKTQEIAHRAAEEHAASHGQHEHDHMLRKEELEEDLKRGTYTMHKDRYNDGSYHFNSMNKKGHLKTFVHKDENEAMQAARAHAMTETEEVMTERDHSTIELKKGGYKKIGDIHLARHHHTGELRFFNSEDKAKSFLKSGYEKKKLGIEKFWQKKD